METITPPALGYLPQMITPQEAAAFLNVTSRTVLNWIDQDRIPYIRLPGGTERAQYRIPLSGLVSSLSGTFDLAAALEEGEAHARAAGLAGEDLRRLAADGTATAE